MEPANREFSALADDKARAALKALTDNVDSPIEYQAVMYDLGEQLGNVVSENIPPHHRCLVVCTAEDADYLSSGVMQSLKKNHETLAAVFWNNYIKFDGGPIAPIVHKYLQPGYESSDILVVVKSIISTSCVVRTNILSLIEKVQPEKIYILAPVIFRGSEESLREEFPENISKRFEFAYFAVDKDRDQSTGDILPGIGGQIYQLLGMTDQPARVGYIPKLVRTLAEL
jgi:hypothetical protein